MLQIIQEKNFIFFWACPSQASVGLYAKSFVSQASQKDSASIPHATNTFFAMHLHISRALCPN